MLRTTRDEVFSWLQRLAEGKVTREEAATWAGQFLLEDAMPDEPNLFAAIRDLAAADTGAPDRDYLFGPEDFEAWLHRFRDGRP